MLHAPADSILSPTGTQSSEIWLLWIHSQGSQPSSPQAPAQPPESALTRVSPGGKRGVGEQTAGSLASGVPRQGARSQRQWLDQGGTWALSRFFLKKVYLFGFLGWRGWWDFQPGASYTDDREGKA